MFLNFEYFITLFIICGMVYYWFICNRRIRQTTDKAILVTGCDSGFGLMSAHRLAQDGFLVFAACLNPKGEGITSLDIYPNIIPLQMDITSDQEVNQAVQEVTEHLRDRGVIGLYGLINNAGIILGGEMEWGSLSSHERVILVNVIGTMRVIRSFLPLIKLFASSHPRSTVQVSPRIINLGSVSSILNTPSMVAYGMSKSAIEGMSHGLRRELFKFGIKVTLIQPDIYKTSMAESGLLVRSLERTFNESTEDVKSSYGERYLSALSHFISHHLHHARPHPHEVVDHIRESVMLFSPSYSIISASLAKVVMYHLLSCLPHNITEPIIQSFVLNRHPLSYAEK